jgi:hypothetical protein
LNETNDKSEDEDGFRIGGGNSSDRGSSRHSGAWWRGQLWDEKMPGSEKEESLDSRVMMRTRGVQILIGRIRPSLRVPAVGSSGSPAGNTRGIARRAVTNGKEPRNRSSSVFVVVDCLFQVIIVALKRIG